MGRSLDVGLLFCVLCIAASQLHSTPASPAPDSPTLGASKVAQFPPPPIDPERAPQRRKSLPPSLRGNADAAMERIANWATLDADPLRRSFAISRDLYGFVQNHLARAAAGDGAASYYIYLALDECRPYLRMDAEEARSLALRMQPDLAVAAAEEQQSWNRDAVRCAQFAGGDLSALVATLGAERPGAEAEYGSVLFERAADAGFPPAMAERALREPGFDPAQRETMLRRALYSGNADVYWQLFRHSWTADASQATASLAWLIEACRNGYDCSADATWFRTGECADGSERCLPAQSALAHYWYAAPTSARESALALAQQIEAAARSSRWDDVPMPAVRDVEQAFAESAMPIEE